MCDSLAHNEISIYGCGINKSQVISQCSQARQFKRMESEMSRLFYQGPITLAQWDIHFVPAAHGVDLEETGGEFKLLVMVGSKV